MSERTPMDLLEKRARAALVALDKLGQTRAGAPPLLVRRLKAELQRRLDDAIARLEAPADQFSLEGLMHDGERGTEV